MSKKSHRKTSRTRNIAPSKRVGQDPLRVEDFVITIEQIEPGTSLDEILKRDKSKIRDKPAI